MSPRKPESAGLEVVRVPMPKPGEETVFKLPIDALTVLVGASVVPGPADDHDETEVGSVEVEVLVDDWELLTARVADVQESPSFYGVAPQPWRNKGMDPMIVTPREGGAAVVVSLKSGAKKKGDKRATVRDWSRWEVHLYVAR